MTYTRQFDFTPLDRGFSAELDVELDAIVTAFDGLKQRKYKTADQDLAGASGAVDDVHLQGFALEAGGIYSVFAVIHLQETIATAAEVDFNLIVSQALSGDSFLMAVGSPDLTGKLVEGHMAVASSGTSIGPTNVRHDMDKNPCFELFGVIVAHASLASTLKLNWDVLGAGTARMFAGAFMFVEKLN